jgi:nucleoside phosphorylase
MARRLLSLLALGVLLPGVVVARPAPGGGLCASASTAPDAPLLVVVSAFPAELAPLVTATAVESIVDVAGRRFYVGRLAGVHVALGLTGIGLVNAATVADAAITAFDPVALVMDGVAGSPRRIADVVVAKDWREGDAEAVYRVNPALFALAVRARTALPEPLARCALVPPTSPDATEVCLGFEPEVVLGGHGSSDDPFGGGTFPCIPGGGEVFGCDVALLARAPAAEKPPDLEDMETAAVARVAAERNLPFLGIRAVSDGAGDPLGDRGFPVQFFDYYRLAAHNGAIVTRALMAEVAALAADPGRRRACRLLSKARWRQAAKRIRPRFGLSGR